MMRNFEYDNSWPVREEERVVVGLAQDTLSLVVAVIHLRMNKPLVYLGDSWVVEEIGLFLSL